MDFRSSSIEFIRRKATWAQGARGFEIVELAAYLFAIATKLACLEGSARMFALAEEDLDPEAEDHQSADLEDLESALQYLGRLPGKLTPTQLYVCLIRVLATIEGELSEAGYEHALRPFTELREFPDGVTGRVHHWLRPPSQLAQLRDYRFEEATEARPPRPQCFPAADLRYLAVYWESEQGQTSVVPVRGESEVTVPSSGGGRQKRVQLKKLLLRWFDLNDDRGCSAFRDLDLRIALCPLLRAGHPLFRIYNLTTNSSKREEGGSASFFSAKNDKKSRPIERWIDLEGQLKEILAATRKEVHLVVCPELTVDLEGREAIRAMLAAEEASDRLGIVAGSFHVWDGSSGTVAGPPANETVLLGPSGAELARHRKKGSFRFSSQLVRLAPHLFCERPNRLSREVYEDIRYGAELQLLETRVGRIALLICADAIAPDGSSYVPLLRRLRPDLVIVVAMSGETEPFVDFARDMGRHWIGTLFVNAHCLFDMQVGRWSRRLLLRALYLIERLGRYLGRLRLDLRLSIPLLAASDLALQENKGQPPSLARWRLGAAEPEVFYYRPSAGKRGWRRLSRAPGKPGVSWLLGSDGLPLGLTIDLGIHGVGARAPLQSDGKMR